MRVALCLSPEETQMRLQTQETEGFGSLQQSFLDSAYLADSCARTHDVGSVAVGSWGAGAAAGAGGGDHATKGKQQVRLQERKHHSRQ